MIQRIHMESGWTWVQVVTLLSTSWVASLSLTFSVLIHRVLLAILLPHWVYMKIKNAACMIVHTGAGEGHCQLLGTTTSVLTTDEKGPCFSVGIQSDHGSAFQLPHL